LPSPPATAIHTLSYTTLFRSSTSAPVSVANSNSVFSASKLIAIDVDEFAHDPELEEAAIRFANGDDAGAEAGLMEVLSPTGQRRSEEHTSALQSHLNLVCRLL